MECSSEFRKSDLSFTQGWITLSWHGLKRVRRFYGDRCIVCGWDEDSCDVAHLNGPENYIENLVILCPNHHRLFDRGKIPLGELISVRNLYYKEISYSGTRERGY